MQIQIVEKKHSGELQTIDTREWDSEMIQSLNYANYILVNQTEYEMVEGRFNVNSGKFELLVEKVERV